MTALRFIIGTVLDLYILTYILRFALQWARPDYNPFWQFVVQVTNPLVRPLRRVIPGWRGIELASPLIILALEALTIVVLLSLGGYPVPAPLPLLYYALLRAIIAVLRLYFFAIFIYVLLSWISPGSDHPLARALGALCEPVLRPVRRFVPPIAGLDLSPLVVLILLQALSMSIPLPGFIA
jgi:YggT family protein